MNFLKSIALIGSLLISSAVFSQQEKSALFFIENETCDIDFKPTTSLADLESFAKCFVYNSPATTAQTTLQIGQINFRKLPPFIDPAEEFPTVANSVRPGFIRLGTYDNFYANTRTNNTAFFAATHNSVLSSSFVLYPSVPQF